jgi:hypothetical protein
VKFIVPSTERKNSVAIVYQSTYFCQVLTNNSLFSARYKEIRMTLAKMDESKLNRAKLCEISEFFTSMKNESL